MQAHTLSAVGILGTVLWRIYSGTILPIFIEIGLYLTEKDQNICWRSFLRHGVQVGYTETFHTEVVRSLTITILQIAI